MYFCVACVWCQVWSVGRPPTSLVLIISTPAPNQMYIVQYRCASQMSPITLILLAIQTHPCSFQTNAIYGLLLDTMSLFNIDVHCTDETMEVLNTNSILTKPKISPLKILRQRFPHSISNMVHLGLGRYWVHFGQIVRRELSNILSIPHQQCVDYKCRDRPTRTWNVQLAPLLLKAWHHPSHYLSPVEEPSEEEL